MQAVMIGLTPESLSWYRFAAKVTSF